METSVNRKICNPGTNVVTSTLTRRFAAPSPSGRGIDLNVPLPLGEGAAKRRVRVEVTNYFFRIRILPTKWRAEESENVIKPGDVMFGSTNRGLNRLNRFVTPSRTAMRRLKGIGISFSTLKLVTKNIGMVLLLYPPTTLFMTSTALYGKPDRVSTE